MLQQKNPVSQRLSPISTPSYAPRHHSSNASANVLYGLQVCTYVGNKQQILRCEVCDSVRGTAWDYYLGLNAEVSSQQAPAREPGGKAAGGATPADPRPSRGQKSILGFLSDGGLSQPMVGKAIQDGASPARLPDHDDAAATCHGSVPASITGRFTYLAMPTQFLGTLCLCSGVQKLKAWHDCTVAVPALG